VGRGGSDSQPDIYITMISSMLGPVVRKLEALDGHIEGLSNNIGTYDIRGNALEGQVASLLTGGKSNEALIKAILDAVKQSETKTANLETRLAMLQNNALLEIVKQNETMITKLQSQNNTLKCSLEYSNYQIHVMGTASKVTFVCLRIGELICASVVAGILGHYLYLLDQADANANDRIVYAVALAGISIAFSIIFMPPFKYAFWAFPLFSSIPPQEGLIGFTQLLLG
jgi:hypothetical protein